MIGWTKYYIYLLRSTRLAHKAINRRRMGMHNGFQLEEKVQWKLASYMTAILKLRIYWLI